MILIGFVRFLRFDELISLKFNDVQVKEQFLILYIHKSKTDLYRQGNAIIMSKLTSVVYICTSCFYTICKTDRIRRLFSKLFCSDRYLDRVTHVN